MIDKILDIENNKPSEDDLNDYIDSIIENKEIKEFIYNNNLDDDKVETYFPIFSNYITQINNNNNVTLQYDNDQVWIQHEITNSEESFHKYKHNLFANGNEEIIFKSVITKEMNDDEQYKQLFTELIDIKEKIENNKYATGILLSGPTKKYKSTIIFAFVRALTKLNKRITVFNWGSFVNQKFDELSRIERDCRRSEIIVIDNFLDSTYENKAANQAFINIVEHAINFNKTLFLTSSLNLSNISKTLQNLMEKQLALKTITSLQIILKNIEI